MIGNQTAYGAGFPSHGLPSAMDVLPTSRQHNESSVKGVGGGGAGGKRFILSSDICK